MPRAAASTQESRLIADAMPVLTPSAMPMSMPSTASSTVAGSRSTITLRTGALSLNERPRSPRTTFLR